MTQKKDNKDDQTAMAPKVSGSFADLNFPDTVAPVADEGTLTERLGAIVRKQVEDIAVIGYTVQDQEIKKFLLATNSAIGKVHEDIQALRESSTNNIEMVHAYIENLRKLRKDDFGKVHADIVTLHVKIDSLSSTINRKIENIHANIKDMYVSTKNVIENVGDVVNVSKETIALRALTDDQIKNMDKEINDLREKTWDDIVEIKVNIATMTVGIRDLRESNEKVFVNFDKNFSVMAKNISVMAENISDVSKEISKAKFFIIAWTVSFISVITGLTFGIFEFFMN